MLSIMNTANNWVEIENADEFVAQADRMFSLLPGGHETFTYGIRNFESIFRGVDGEIPAEYSKALAQYILNDEDYRGWLVDDIAEAIWDCDKRAAWTAEKVIDYCEGTEYLEQEITAIVGSVAEEVAASIKKSQDEVFGDDDEDGND